MFAIAVEEGPLHLPDCVVGRVDVPRTETTTELAAISHDRHIPQSPSASQVNPKITRVSKNQTEAHNVDVVQPATGPVTSPVQRVPASSPLPSSFVIPVVSPV